MKFIFFDFFTQTVQLARSSLIYGSIPVHIHEYMTIHDNTWQYMNSRILGFSGVYMILSQYIVYMCCHTTIYIPEKPRILEFMYWHVMACIGMYRLASMHVSTCKYMQRHANIWQYMNYKTICW